MPACIIENNSCVLGPGVNVTVDGGPDAMMPPPQDAHVEDSAVMDTNPILPDAGLPMADAGCDAEAGCYQIPLGWTLVGYTTSGGDNCPAGFGQGQEVAPDPTVSAASCNYAACTIQEQPTCSVSVTAGCVLSSGTSPSGVCNETAFGLGGSAQFSASAGGGACNAGVTSTPPLTSALVCPAPCDGGICSPPLGALQPCIQAPGSQMCPADMWGFPNPHHVGATVSIECPPEPCTVSATCGGTVMVYQYGQCGQQGGNVGTAAANGQCIGVGSVGSYEYQGSPSNTKCLTGEAGAPSISWGDAGEQTLCCR
jgi:hypothetical protein